MSDQATTPALPETPRGTPQGDCRIAARPAGAVLQAVAPPFGGLSSPVLAERLAEIGAPRAAGPGVWYVVGEAPVTAPVMARLRDQLGESVHLIDQTHGRVRIELSGPGAERLMATGSAVNLSLDRFPVGSACETLFRHVGVHITRVGPDRFELLVGRSFALSLWEDLTN